MNRLREAFTEGGNLLGLAAVAALSAAFLNPDPLFVGVAAEAAYLLFVPDSPWYRDRLIRRAATLTARQRAQRRHTLFPTLRPELAARFQRLEVLSQQIASQNTANEPWFRELLAKLDYLTDTFLTFAAREEEFREYLAGLYRESRGEQAAPRGQRNKVNPIVVLRAPVADWSFPPKTSEEWVGKVVFEIQAYYARETNQLASEVDHAQDDDTKSVLSKRLDVLHRRREHVATFGKTLINLTHQMELLEDTFGLINDEVRARAPDQVISDVDEVVIRTEVMTKSLNEMGSFDQLIARHG